MHKPDRLLRLRSLPVRASSRVCHRALRRRLAPLAPVGPAVSGETFAEAEKLVQVEMTPRIAQRRRATGRCRWRQCMSCAWARANLHLHRRLRRRRSGIRILRRSDACMKATARLCAARRRATLCRRATMKLRGLRSGSFRGGSKAGRSHPNGLQRSILIGSSGSTPSCIA